MKFKSLFLTLLCMALSGSVFAGAPNTWQGKGRIAFSSDGNFHDHDDIQATKMSMMIIAKEGLQDKLVLYTYADHIWGSNSQLENMHTVALGSKERFGYHDATFMAAVENPSAAYNAMAQVISVSTADDPLFIVAAGPMQVVGEGLKIANASHPNSLNYVTVISHSDWNNNHGQSFKAPETKKHNGWTWNMMKSSFGSKVNFHRISDQNGTPPNIYSSNDKFKASNMSYWSWMKTHQDPNVNWVYQNHTGKGDNSAADYSDAGMAYYLLTGDEMGNPVKLKNFIGPDLIPVSPADPLKVARVNLNVNEYHIKNIDGTFQLQATILPVTATNKSLTWTSSNTEVATVSATGLVTGLKLGNAIITVKTVDGNKTNTCQLQVGEVEAAAYEAGDDYVVFEAEWTKSPLQNWKLREPGWAEYIEGSSGVKPINNTYLEYTGGTEDGNVSGQDVLVYKFKPKTSGKYWLTGRMAQNQNGAAWDKCNDVYVKMEGDFTSGNSTPLTILNSWTKLYGRGLEDWGAFVQLDVNHTKYKPVYDLKAGVEYTFSVSGRATRTCVDYFLFFKDGSAVQVAEKLDLATHAPEYMRPKMASATCTTIKAHDFTNTSVSGYDVATKGTIPNSPADGVNKGVQVIGCGGSKGLTKPIAAEVSYNGASSEVTFTLKTVGEPDGECTFAVFINGTKIGETQASRIFGTDVAPYTYENLTMNEVPVALNTGDVIRVTSNQVSNNLVLEGASYATARGRWASIDICGNGMAGPKEESVSFLDLLPAISTSQLKIPFKIEYSVNEARDINVALNTPEGTYVKNKTISVAAGSGIETITVELDNTVAAANNYKLNAAIRPVGGNWQTNIVSEDANINFIDGVVLPSEDAVQFVEAASTYPNTMLTLPVPVNFKATQKRDINIEIKDPSNKYLMNKRITVEGGFGDTLFHVTLASNLPIANGYKMILAIRPVGGSWKTNLDSKEMLLNITDGGAEVPIDEIDYVNLPATFPNTTNSFSIDVAYHTTLQRDFSLELKDANFKHLGDTAITMEAGKGNTTITLDIPSQLAIAEKYQFILTIRLVGQDWSTNITRKDAYFNIVDGGGIVTDPTVDIREENTSVAVGNVIVLNASSEPLGKKITWTSSDESIAAVTDDGTVTGIKMGDVKITASIEGGSKDVCAVNVIAATGLSSLYGPSIQLFPNPSSDKVYFIGMDKMTRVKIANLQGQILSEQNVVQGLNQIEMSDMNKGIYLVMITFKDHSVITKYISKI